MNHIKSQFPIFQNTIHGKPICFLDSAASAQKPQAVLDKMMEAMTKYYANVHRGAYFFSEESTAQYENARKICAKFIDAHHEEVIFCANATMAINLVALSYGQKFLKKDDIIVLSIAEHHANLVPWQMLCEKIGCKLDFVPISSSGELNLEYYAKAVKNAQFVAINYVSNVLGTINPIKDLVALAHENGAKILIDASQAAPHLPKISVRDCNCDFLVCTAHKLYGPTGIGLLYGKSAILQTMPPVIGGGDMIDSVKISGTTYAMPPQRFEAGTPNFIQAIGFGAALEFMAKMQEYDYHAKEVKLANELSTELKTMPQVRLIGTAPQKIGLVSFVINGAHPHDCATLLDQQGVCVRAGLHCAEPLANFLGINGSIRVSYGMYNDDADNAQFLQALRKTIKILGV